MSSRTAELFNQGLDFFTADLTRPMDALSATPPPTPLRSP